MKSYIKWLAAAVLLLAVIVPLVMTGPDGRPVMALDDWLPNVDRLMGLVRQWTGERRPALEAHSTVDTVEVPDVADATPVPDEAPSTLAPDSGKMYKWRDDQGRWHFSNRRPGDTEQVTLEDLPQVRNVMDVPEASKPGGTMGGLGDAGQILEKLQGMAGERGQ